MASSGLVERFAAQARRQAATVAMVDRPVRIPQAVADYLAHCALRPQILVAPDALDGIGWRNVAGLSVLDREIAPDGDTVITGCHGAVAEGGAVVMLGGHAAELNFLPETHIVLLDAARICETLEAFWNRLAEEYPAAAMPRTMNFIVGPSRTADLGVPSRLGAHGPARLHVIVTGTDR